MSNIGICHRCPNRQRPCAGACLCLKDGQDIIEHAKSGYCPEKLYGDGIKPPAWGSLDPNQLALLKMEQAGMSPEVVRAGEGGGCGCEPPTE